MTAPPRDMRPSGVQPGLWIPLVTPFHRDRVDLDALQALARGLVKEGITGGAVLFGSTGEGHLLSIAERRDAADAVRDATLRSELVARGRVPVFCGDDTAFLAHAIAGGQGANRSAHVRPDLFAAILRLVETDAVPLAQEWFDAVLQLIHALFREPNPAPLKALLARQGRIHDELRRPLTPASRTLGRQVHALAAALPSRDLVQRLRDDVLATS